MQSIHLQGSEEVSRAASTISSAASTMATAASSMHDAVDRQQRIHEDFLQQLEAIVQKPLEVIQQLREGAITPNQARDSLRLHPPLGRQEPYLHHLEVIFEAISGTIEHSSCFNDFSLRVEMPSSHDLDPTRFNRGRIWLDDVEYVISVFRPFSEECERGES